MTASIDAPLRVALVNDYEIVLRGLHAMLAPFSDRIVVVEHEVGGTPDQRADLALFDTFAGRRDAVHRAADMAREGAIEHVVLYTWDAAPGFVDAARDAGVAGIVLKSVEGRQLVDQLHRVAQGERIGLDASPGTNHRGAGDALSLREQEVLALMALGYSNRRIADELYLSVETVKTYVRRVFTKLGVNNRTNAALLAAEYDLGPSDRRRQVAGVGE